jgi:lysophospholipase L1-like esterase
LSRKRCPPIASISKLSVVVLLLLVAAANAVCANDAPTRWIGSWTAAQQLVEPNNALALEDLRDGTLRQIVHLSIGGSELRLRLSNRFGTGPLHITAVHVAQPVSAGSDRIVEGSDKALTFSGTMDVIIPAHADYVSDPVSFSVQPLSDLAVTLHVEAAPTEQTGHPGSRSTSYISHGDLVSAIELPGAKRVEHWYFIAGIEVPAPSGTNAVAILGDSITDGHGATTNGNNRWTDVLARRLLASATTRNIAVLNQGIGGNRLLNDGLGPNALARFDSDVVAQPEVRYVIILEGINDLGMLTLNGEVPRAEHDALVQRMIEAYQQMIVRAHAHSIRVIGGTLLPFGGSSFYHPGPANEADRQTIDEWIRAAGHFDAVIDFDKITRDPQHPDRMLPAFDCGDHLHPSPTGYAAMGEAVPLSLFTEAVDSPKIAITFDDLPAHGLLPPGETRVAVITKIIAALRQANVPPTYGFVNGLRIQEEPGGVAVLEAWRSAGNPLGNHSWSHMNLNQHSLEEFEQDVVRDEAVLTELMKSEDWRWFRYPFLAEGDTPEKRAGFRNFLRERGYQVAAVTMSFGDYLWNEPYARCRAKNDTTGIAKLEESYLAAADESIEYYRSISRRLYQRDIPYVLLMHVGAFDAEMLPRLLQLYRSKGFGFVTLGEAERDEFYRNSTDLNLPPGPDMLEGAAAARQQALPTRTNFAAQVDSVCR